MYRNVVSLFALVAIAVLLGVAGAQEEEQPESYIYATYFECDVSMQWRVDEIAKTVYAPVYDAAVEEGTINAWGWLAHHTGGKWRRIIYYVAPSMDSLLDAQDKLSDAVAEKNGPATREVGRICNSHDDYVWKRVAGSGMNQDRGGAGFSVYMDCDMSREERADEIVQSVMAPVYDRHVQEGHLVSWGWNSHFIGGKWRRLATTTAKDVKSLLKARAAVMQEISEKHGEAMKEFGEICGAHQDYIWEIQLETP
jgi:hypothetical protein